MQKTIQLSLCALLLFGLVGCNSSKSKKRQIRTGGTEKGRTAQPLQDSTPGKGLTVPGQSGVAIANTNQAALTSNPEIALTDSTNQTPGPLLTTVDVGADTAQVEDSPLFKTQVSISILESDNDKMTLAKWKALDPELLCLGSTTLGGCNSLIIKEDGSLEEGPQKRTRAILLKTGSVTDADTDFMFELPLSSLKTTKAVETLVVFKNNPKYLQTYQSIKNKLQERATNLGSAQIFPLDLSKDYIDFTEVSSTLIGGLENSSLNIDASRIIFNITDTENGCVKYTVGGPSTIDCRDARSPQVLANQLSANGLLSSTEVYDVILSSNTDLDLVATSIEQLTRQEAEQNILIRSIYLPHREDQIQLDSVVVKLDGAQLEMGKDFVIIKSISTEYDKIQIDNLEKLNNAQVSLELTYKLK